MTIQRKIGFLAGALASLFIGCHQASAGPSVVGSDNSTDTWAGDAQMLSLPTGTFVLQQYLSYERSKNYLAAPADNVFAKLTAGQVNIPSSLDLYSEMTRVSYYTSLMGHPLVFEGSVRAEKANTVNVGNFPGPIGGLGPQTIKDGWTDPVVSVTYGVIADRESGTYLSVASYFYLPLNIFDNFKQFNVTTPHQFTWVPQIAFTQRIVTVSPTLGSFWFDFIGNMSVHSKGGSVLALAPGIQFDTLTQDNSYNLKAFLRYEFMTGGFLAGGVEWSGGGKQLASGGVLQTIFGGPTSFGTDQYTRAHVQFATPLPYDFQFALDVAKDFQRAGGFKDDILVELRLTKLFSTAAPPSGMPVKALPPK
jgi:hypothetical protein